MPTENSEPDTASVSRGPQRRSTLGRIIVLVALVAVVAAFFALGGGEYVSFEYLKARQADFERFYAEHRVVTIAVFVAVYLVVAGASVPGTVPLSLLAGAVFGRWAGTVVVSFASTAGASVALVIIRYLLRPVVESKLGGRLEPIRRGFQRDGAFYLFLLRLTPVAPFFIVNAAMAVMPIRVRSFWWVSQLGMLPATFLYVNAGTELARLESWRGILSPSLIVSFVALGMFPLVVRKLVGRLRGASSNKMPNDKADE
jgi:uncharacterized membrane protein YdjX (TVP38/TMEM64 family)